MTRVLILSDLHFGFHRTELIEPMLTLVRRLNIDLALIAGDVSHRGRPEQLEMAASFLRRMELPIVAVPGNHDVPLFNIPLRLIRPYQGFCQQISPDLAPTRRAGQVQVFGVNSVDPFAWQRGIIHRDDFARVEAGIDRQAVNIVMLHHPLEQLPVVDKALARNAPEFLDALARCGASIVVTGHLHVWNVAKLLEQTRTPSVLQIHTASALCARAEDPPNEFAVLDVDGPELTIERYIAAKDRSDFRPIFERYRQQDGLWQAVDQCPDRPRFPGASDTAFKTA